MLLPLTLRPKPSAVLAAALVAAHGLVAAGLIPTTLPLFLKSALWCGLALSLAFYQWHLWRPVVALTLLPDGGIEVEGHDGVRIGARVLPQTTVFPWLCVLRLKLEGRSLALPLLPDSLDAENFRQLRLWLRWKAVA